MRSSDFLKVVWVQIGIAVFIFLAQLVPLFDAGMIGPTDTLQQTAELTRTFPNYFENGEELGSVDGYTIGWISRLFLFGPDAGFVDSSYYRFSAEDIRGALQKGL